ncbi:MAG TPA: hypothetical protein DCK87_05170 [Desulfotomaculum sp.]|nr:hypothetical protein [Desulfotomaculum sp.]
MEINTTFIAQLFNYVVMLLSFIFLIIFVPVLLLKLNKRVKNIEEIVTKLQRNNEKSGEAEGRGKGE